MTNQTLTNHIETTQPALKRCYVKNPYPCYTPQIANYHPPKVVKAVAKAAKENRPSRSYVWKATYRYQWRTGQQIVEQRSTNLHRRRAMDAVCVYFASHFNLVTFKVHGSLAQISDACGLTTYNAKGVPSYSRASRVITEHLEAAGAVIVHRKWDDTSGSYIPNYFEVTELFFELIDFEYGKILSAQQQQLAWENQGLKEKGEEPISVTEAKRRAKDKHLREALSFRAKRITSKKAQKRYQKLVAMDEREAKHKIQNDLLKMYSKDEIVAMGMAEFKRLVNQRYHQIKKLAASTAPPPDSS